MFSSSQNAYPQCYFHQNDCLFQIFTQVRKLFKGVYYYFSFLLPARIIQGRKLFKGAYYSRKYGTYFSPIFIKILVKNGTLFHYYVRITLMKSLKEDGDRTKQKSLQFMKERKEYDRLLLMKFWQQTTPYLQALGEYSSLSNKCAVQDGINVQVGNFVQFWVVLKV